MLSPTEIAIVGGIVSGLFGIIHHLQNRRLNKVEENMVNEKICEVRHTAINDKLDDIKGMVKYLRDDRVAWKKKNGHSEEGG